ncbi:hypothetical protein [Polymorphum gilvum]|jgi:hypothetical protein|uniref:DUF883 domain-containing protein n=1 Tax=Polymorphum gilvum (strain LMG 25793 / CGMCC 1.9160 / SL003B-26A1) TaxID=991905 RepID=F2J162_POLGS|nr:hypothetical protein [Polymorphum gilvum]ADZ68708.1 hypothetical protein SL003B_0272 [Polymorphum gilvum SL003B-26A1]
MSLMSEIQALRDEFQALARRAPSVNGNEDPAAASQEPLAERVSEPHDVETLLKEVNATLDEFAEELDRFPRLTALAALGVGLAAGVVIGRQLR